MHRTAEFTLSLPGDEAMALFTPEGERQWADGWDPQYPDPSRREGPGAVFTTAHGDHDTTWIMVDQRPDSVRYARVVHGMNAGTVTVEGISAGEGSTRIRVTYDLTHLSSAGQDRLRAFEADYETEIAAWASEIAAALSR